MTERRERDRRAEAASNTLLACEVDKLNKRIAELQIESNRLQINMLYFITMMNGFGLDLIRCGIGGNYSGDPYEKAQYVSAANIVKEAEMLIDEIDSKNESKPF